MPVPEVDIPFHKFTLDNGLTLIVHEDHKAPIVAVDVWYHVGSKDERPGRTGFAHLFEHLMFSGSEHYDDEYFRPFEEVGATDMNGTTSEDRTNFFENVPSSALDLALWMESDRMGSLLGAINQDKLDEQRDVVKNEKRQRENTPYGQVWQLLPPNTYPAGHPYSWSVIGSMEDLDDSSLEDVHAWFRRFYGAANAVLVIAGDVTPDEALAKVRHYFGHIPSGPPVVRQQAWVAKMHGTHRQVLQDRVPQARIYKVWNVPPRMTDEAVDLELAASLLAGSKNARLYQRLVYGDQLATDVVATLNDREIGSQFMIWATARPGVALEEVERALDEEMARFLAKPVDGEELERARNALLADFLRGTERIGGFGGKADILASSQIYGGSPDAYKREIRRLAAIDPVALQRTANAWLDDGVFALEVQPFEESAADDDPVDRSAPPQPGRLPDLTLPRLERTTLSNGLPVILARRDAVPLVQMRMVVNAGYAADSLAAPGTSSLALNLMDEGTTRRSSLDISRELERLGAHFSTGSSLDASSINLSALVSELDPSLALYAEILREPTFPEREIERLKRERLARIQQEKSQPTGLGLRVLPPLLYGPDHAYSVPLTGSGTEAAVEQLTREQVVEFHRRWIRPDNATLIVVGDVSMEQLKPLLEKYLGEWQAFDTPLPHKPLLTVDNAPGQRLFLMNRSGAEQSVILAGRLAPPRNNPDDIAMETVNAILGGLFMSRLNLNLREDKHWSYGARSLLLDARGQQPFIAMAPVQADKTAEAVTEMRGDIAGLLGQRPATAQELEAAQKNLTLKLPGEHETNGEVASTIAESVIFDLPDTYYTDYVSRVRALTRDDLARAGQTLFGDQSLTWLVVGDLATIEPQLRGLAFDTIQVLDADGQIIR